MFAKSPPYFCLYVLQTKVLTGKFTGQVNRLSLINFEQYYYVHDKITDKLFNLNLTCDVWLCILHICT